MAVSLLKRGFNLAKPHLKTAATNIVGDVVSNIVRNMTTKQQEGIGLMVYTKRSAKRPLDMGVANLSPTCVQKM